jgi:hypothetical protein
MTIFKRAGSVLLTTAALAAGVGLAASPAFAGTGSAVAATWTVKPGGAITAKAGTTKLHDVNTNQNLQCTSSSGKGSVKSGSGLSGTGIGSITALTFSNCTGPLGLTFTVKTSAFPWHLNAVSFSSGVTTGTITHIHATLTGPGCSATVDGTSATANNGMVKAKYSNGTGKLTTLTSGGNLHVYNVSGCAGLINSGDATTFSGSYAISPKQTITSP